MRRFGLPLLVLVSVSAIARAEVTIVSDGAPFEVDVAPDRVFECEVLPWTDPEASLPPLVFYRVRGATGPIHVRRAGDAIEVWGEGAPAEAPASGGTIEAAAWWGDVHVKSGTAIGRGLHVEPSAQVVLRDPDGSASERFVYDPATFVLETDGANCLWADDTGTHAIPCSGSPRQQWVMDREGRLRANTCEGEWACLVSPGLEDGAAPLLQPCNGAQPLPEERWAVERWNEPVDGETLRAGLGMVELPFEYYPVAAVEGSAVPVVLAPGGRPVIAAGSAGLGRAVAFGTWQSVCGATVDRSFDKLLRKLVRWAGRSASPLIGLSPEAANQRSCFEQLGYATVDVTPSTLGGVDVYVMRGGDDGAPAADVDPIEAFLRGGGGLLASHHAFFYWDLQQYPPTDNLLARVFSTAGLAWGEDLDLAVAPGTLVDLSGDPPAKQEHQITAAFEAFVRHRLGVENLTSAELAAIEANMPVAVTARARLNELSPFTVAQRALERIHGPLLVGPSQPFTWGDPLGDMTLRGSYLLAEALPPDRTPAHASAALYPGLVAADAPRVTRTVELDGDVPDTGHEMWRSTGLYAPPGEKVTFTFPASAVDAGLFVQIGASFDNVMPHAGWLAPSTIGRFPWITAGRLVQSEQVELAGAFGGPILISVPRGSALGTLPVEIGGGVEAPSLAVDASGAATWQGDLDDAPLMELQSDHVILTIRSGVVAGVDDPATALHQLDAMIAAESDLVGIDGDPAGGESIPQRVVFDPFEEWGAHSGYPVHMTQSWDAEVIDGGVWPGGSGLWGFLHELGHNHQQAMWTLDHQWEVTCNILAVHAFETVLGLPMSQAWGGNLEPATMQQRTQAWLASGQPYHQQGYDVGLYFFLYVKEAFGWEPFETMYAGYRALPEGQRPESEQDKIDQLAVRLSNAAGRNLVPWFETFRFPLSAWVSGEVDHLPTWDDAPF